jgi:hypothetical protein
MRRISSICIRLRRARRRPYALAATAGAAAAAALALPAAAPAAPSCEPSGSDTVCTFSYTGGAQTWTVPAGVSEATFEVSGAAGGDTRVGAPGGLGGRATATIAVTPADTLQVNVGGTPGTHHVFGGFNGGGFGAEGEEGISAGGGGGSDVRSGAFALADRIIIAGGGGGATAHLAGGAGGGTTGGAGSRPDLFGHAGGGGTQTAGGAGGLIPYPETIDGRDGIRGSGGGGGSCLNHDGDFVCEWGGGGGGGGYYGGGGGGDWGSGGGGSGFGPDGVVFQSGVRAGNGIVRITYSAPPPADTTPPTTTIALDPSSPDGQNGWYVSAVHATVSAVDEAGGSGVAGTSCALDPTTIPASFADLPAGCAYPGADVTDDGTHVLYAASKDSAGNAETPVSQSFKLDRTAPAASCAAAPSFLLNEAGGSVSATVTDATSGAAQSPISADADTASVGAKNADLTGADVAGNHASIGCAYAVTYGFEGFLAPVADLDANGDPVLNVVMAGRAIPLKWRLTDATGAPVTTLTDAQITVVGIPCGLDTTLDQLEETTAGASGLQHLGDGNYQLNWKSPTGYANSCKRLRLDLSEGSITNPTYHTVDLKFIT